MDENRKNAYRYILYWAMVEIRGIAWIRFRWWNPFSARRDFRHAQFAGELADAMHNLGLFSSIDFKGFDEERFWNEFESVKERFAEFQLESYQWRFENRLEELNSKSNP